MHELVNAKMMGAVGHSLKPLWGTQEKKASCPGLSRSFGDVAFTEELENINECLV